MTIISRYRGVSKDAFLCHFISLPVLCFRLRLGISSVSISSISATSKKLFPRSPSLKYSTSGVRKKRRGSNGHKLATEQAWYACARPTCLMQLSKRAKHRQSNTRKEMSVLSCSIDCLMAFKFYHTRSNRTKQGGQTVKCLVSKQCLMVFGRQTFPL